MARDPTRWLDEIIKGKTIVEGIEGALEQLRFKLRQENDLRKEQGKLRREMFELEERIKEVKYLQVPYWQVEQMIRERKRIPEWEGRISDIRFELGRFDTKLDEVGKQVSGLITKYRISFEDYDKIKAEVRELVK